MFFLFFRTGYYTSRPFYKGFDRIVQHTLRAAEILFSIVVSRFGFSSQPRFQVFLKFFINLLIQLFFSKRHYLNLYRKQEIFIAFFNIMME